ncbi:hypothetical protein BDV96DRAFT_43445 [Lophiotrema nucula]|uniref:Uncharacterized protein n=1 Tax=Lophiotrema nucula TaxID=690887 RepID=A0A6A5Z9J4_9PLEO|nr:hypothetical protein BDV96DRAFT_43445 [Lophiotrema nucula]
MCGGLSRKEEVCLPYVLLSLTLATLVVRRSMGYSNPRGSQWRSHCVRRCLLLASHGSDGVIYLSPTGRLLCSIPLRGESQDISTPSLVDTKMPILDFAMASLTRSMTTVIVMSITHGRIFVETRYRHLARIGNQNHQEVNDEMDRQYSALNAAITTIR